MTKLIKLSMLMAVIAIIMSCTGSKKNKTESDTTDQQEVSVTDSDINENSVTGKNEDAETGNKPEKASVKYRYTLRMPYDEDKVKVCILTADNYGKRWRFDDYTKPNSDFHWFQIVNHLTKTNWKGNSEGISNDLEYWEGMHNLPNMNFLNDWANYEEKKWIKLPDTIIAGKKCNYYTRTTYDFSDNPWSRTSIAEYKGVMMYSNNYEYSTERTIIWDAIDVTTNVPEIAFDKSTVEPTWIME